MTKFTDRLKRLHGSRIRAVEAAERSDDEAPRVFRADDGVDDDVAAPRAVDEGADPLSGVEDRWLERGARQVSTELGQALMLSRSHGGDEHYGGCRLVEGLDVDVTAVLRRVAGLFASEVAADRVAYLDLETDGLGDGPAFCVGIGVWEGADFVVHQLALPRLDDERALLRATTDRLEGIEALVTFNGRSFDVPRLEARYRRVGLASPLSGLAHVDLLEVSRRVLPKRKSYRLQVLERDVLGLRRHGDVPGSEAPKRWARYLADGDPGPLLDLFEHNRLDIVSLVALLVYVSRPSPKAKSQPRPRPQPAHRPTPSAEPEFRQKLERSYRLKKRNDEARQRRGAPGSTASAARPAPGADAPLGERLRGLRLEATGLIEAGDFDAAAPILHQMAALSPTNPFPLKHLAAYYRALGDESLAALFEARLKAVAPY